MGVQLKPFLYKTDYPLHLEKKPPPRFPDLEPLLQLYRLKLEFFHLKGFFVAQNMSI